MPDEGLGRSPGEEAADTLSERQHKETGAMTVAVGADEKVYPVLKLAAVLDALAAFSQHHLARGVRRSYLVTLLSRHSRQARALRLVLVRLWY